MSEDKTPKILDEEHLLESANDSARHFRNIYAVYLAVMIYILIIVLSTDQELLFREADRQLPLVYISVPIIVPIVAFFVWMPWAFLVLHFYLLIQVMFLSEKVHLYKQEINNHLESEKDIRKAQMLLASIPLAHILVEEKVKRKHAMLYLMVFVSLVVFPLIVLIVTPITFLPYQSEPITWSHRIVILIDLLMLWGFGHYVFRSHKGKIIWINSVAGLLVVLVPVFVVIVVFINFPGNKIYSSATAGLYELEWVKKIMPSNRFVLPYRKLMGRELVPGLLATQIREQMDNENLIEQDSFIWCQYADPLYLKGRNFREAYLPGAILCKALLQDADLTDADLSRANLTEAELWNANLTNADLGRANLTDADLSRANLTEANLWSANLTEAVLSRANLTEVILSGANLISANLWNADLTGADLSYANLTDTVLIGADLAEADLIDADLTAANLSETDFSNAVLDETTLDFTWVWGSSFPKGIPRGWSGTLKPEYSCLEDFYVSNHIDISEYINKDGEIEREKLKERLEQIMEEKCKPYKR